MRADHPADAPRQSHTSRPSRIAELGRVHGPPLGGLRDNAVGEHVVPGAISVLPPQLLVVTTGTVSSSSIVNAEPARSSRGYARGSQRAHLCGPECPR